MKGKKKKKVGPHIPSDSRDGGDQMSTGTADRDPGSEIERRWSPRLSGSDFGHLD